MTDKGIDKNNSIGKLFGNLDEWDTGAWIEILDGFNESYIESDTDKHGIMFARLDAFIWVRDKIRQKGVDIDDQALAYMMFK